MSFKTLVLTCIALIAVGCVPVLSAQDPAAQLSLEAFFIDPPKANTATRLWVRITNRTRRAQILCRSARGYAWISDDPQEDAAIHATASLHGCGDDDHDPLWLLLPGESRFDSYEVTGPSRPTSTLEVDVDVMHYPLGMPGPGQRLTLTWKGRVSEAIALGSTLRTSDASPDRRPDGR
jgi:hypothetical protein